MSAAATAAAGAPAPAELQDGKLAALEAAAADAGLDAIVVQDVHALRWLTGYSPFMRILPPTAQVGVWRPGGPVTLVPIAFYVNDARRRAPWLDVADPAPKGVAAAVRSALAGARRVGLAGVTWVLGTEIARDVEVVPADALVAGVRARKTPGEVACVARALAVAEAGMEAAAAAAAPGVSEEEVAAAAEHAMRVRGGDGHAIVARAERAAWLTELAGPDRLGDGDCVLVDLGCYLDGYRGEYARTFVVGEPSPEIRAAHAATERALDRAAAALRAGAAASDVAEAARRSLEDEGYAPATLPYPVGHGLGVSGGEPPAVERGSGDTVPDGAVVNLEPGVFDPGRGLAVRLEDTYRVGPAGAERMTTTARDLVVCR